LSASNRVIKGKDNSFTDEVAWAAFGPEYIGVSKQ